MRDEAESRLRLRAGVIFSFPYHSLGPKDYQQNKAAWFDRAVHWLPNGDGQFSVTSRFGPKKTGCGSHRQEREKTNETSNTILATNHGKIMARA